MAAPWAAMTSPSGESFGLGMAASVILRAISNLFREHEDQARQVVPKAKINTMAPTNSSFVISEASVWFIKLAKPY
jgi:hypothetical protein